MFKAADLFLLFILLIADSQRLLSSFFLLRRIKPLAHMLTQQCIGN